MWKNTVQPDRPQMAIWRMRIACRIPKATNILSEYVIRIAFPLQQMLHDRASVLRYSYIACLFSTYKKTPDQRFTLSDGGVIANSKSRFIKQCHSTINNPTPQLTAAQS
jgi:hypothetical protein